MVHLCFSSPALIFWSPAINQSSLFFLQYFFFPREIYVGSRHLSTYSLKTREQKFICYHQPSLIINNLFLFALKGASVSSTYSLCSLYKMSYLSCAISLSNSPSVFLILQAAHTQLSDVIPQLLQLCISLVISVNFDYALEALNHPHQMSKLWYNLLEWKSEMPAICSMVNTVSAGCVWAALSISTVSTYLFAACT